MRIAVVGTSGSGKTTMAKLLAAELALPHIELDAVEWEAGWQALSQIDPDEFVRRVASAVAAEAWVIDGNYGMVRALIWGRATHLVWLDYGLPVVMYRVIRRSLVRAARQTTLWAGNKETWRRVLRPSAPIRWAWRTWPMNRREFEHLIGHDEYAHLVVLRVRRPQEAEELVRQLIKPAIPLPEQPLLHA